MSILQPIFLTLVPGNKSHTTYKSRGYYSPRMDVSTEQVEGFYLTVVDPTHFILLDNEEGEKLPEWVPTINEVPSKFLYSFHSYGRVYPIEGVQTVLQLAQEAEDRVQSEIDTYEAHKAKEEARKESLRPMIEAFFLDNKEKGSFSLYDRANSMQVRHIHWTTSESINYDKVEAQGESYLQVLMERLVSKRNQVVACWDKEAHRDNLKEAVAELLPKELKVFCGNDYKVYIRPTSYLLDSNDNCKQVSTVEEVPGLVSEYDRLWEHGGRLFRLARFLVKLKDWTLDPKTREAARRFSPLVFKESRGKRESFQEEWVKCNYSWNYLEALNTFGFLETHGLSLPNPFSYSSTYPWYSLWIASNRPNLNNFQNDWKISKDDVLIIKDLELGLKVEHEYEWVTTKFRRLTAEEVANYYNQSFRKLDIPTQGDIALEVSDFFTKVN